MKTVKDVKFNWIVKGRDKKYQACYHTIDEAKAMLLLIGPGATLWSWVITTYSDNSFSDQGHEVFTLYVI